MLDARLDVGRSDLSAAIGTAVIEVLEGPVDFLLGNGVLRCRVWLGCPPRLRFFFLCFGSGTPDCCRGGGLTISLEGGFEGLLEFFRALARSASTASRRSFSVWISCSSFSLREHFLANRFFIAATI